MAAFFVVGMDQEKAKVSSSIGYVPTGLYLAYHSSIGYAPRQFITTIRCRSTTGQFAIAYRGYLPERVLGHVWY
eukprot:297841-Rhodomonas_salina.11